MFEIGSRNQGRNEANNKMEAFIGVDVGTGSARAGIFDGHGKLLAQAAKEIETWRPATDFVEQSSDDIWSSVCQCIRSVLQESGCAASDVKGIGFDATCSLVLVDINGQPVSVSPSGNDHQNIVVWMDHRASEEAAEINQTDFELLKYVGGKISPEMETPKLLWLKRNLPKSWKRAAHFFDLPDFLTWRATGSTVRSLCSTVCKWTYLGHQQQGWDAEFFRSIGLEEFVTEQFRRIGTDIQPMGQAVGDGLSQQAAAELGLQPETAVSVSMIDAHAGGIGMIGAAIHGDSPTADDMNGRLALIGGTSSCHMAVSKEPRFIDGIWGPYFSAMVPGYWLTEGGQSATGSLVDLVVYQSGASSRLQELAKQANVSEYEILNERLRSLAKGRPVAILTQKLHVCPYFHGNRSPRADPELRGMISGLRLSRGIDDLALVYLATIQAIAYGTKHIIDVMNEKGYAIDTIMACGGGTKNDLFVQSHADITGCQIVLPREPESVLLGSAMLGATAAGQYRSLVEAMAGMSAAETIIDSNQALKDFHASKYLVFHQMYEDQIRYDQMMT